MKKWKLSRVTAADVSRATGMSRSEFKAKLRRAGFKVPRNFYGFGSHCMSRGSLGATGKGRLYRVHFNALEVDESCVADDFDRWANSTDDVYSMHIFMAKFFR